MGTINCKLYKVQTKYKKDVFGYDSSHHCKVWSIVRVTSIDQISFIRLSWCNNVSAGAMFLCEVTRSQSGLWLVDRYLRQSVAVSSGISSSSVRFYTSGQKSDQSYHYSSMNVYQSAAAVPVWFTLIGCLIVWSESDSAKCSDYLLVKYLLSCVSSVRAVWWWILTSGSTSWLMRRRWNSSWGRGSRRLGPQDWWLTETASRSQVTLWGHRGECEVTKIFRNRAANCFIQDVKFLSSPVL